MIAYLGKNLPIEYGDNGSPGHTSSLVSIFAANGIQCTYTTYTSERVNTSLLNNFPVIIRAEGRTDPPFSLVSGGHSFIIDGYIRNAQRTTMTYRFVYDEGVGGLLPNPPEYVVITYGTPSIAYYHMNWGWDNLYDYTWYSMTGDWDIELYGLEYSYTYDRYIIHEFSVI